jgi:S-(hydroxymethyl)glutathione synthase
MAPLSLHPLLDSSLPKGSPTFPGGTLRCKCPSSPVEIALTSNIQHNHACGCSKCWKPPGALFSIVGVIPSSSLEIHAHPEKLDVVDDSAVIWRHACKECRTHMFGRIEGEHAFKGLDFVHVELSEGGGREGTWVLALAVFKARTGSNSMVCDI